VLDYVRRTNFPSLNVDQYTTFRYNEDQDKDESAVKPDVWQPIYDWITLARNDPQKITAGVNLVQFIDCLAV
jgi:hypothetical protein